MILNFIKKIIFDNQRIYTILKIPVDFLRWRKSLYRSPAPKYVKRSVIKSLSEYNSVLIETGTFKGQFIINLHKHFSKCITIEPVNEYYEIAKKNLRFLEHKVELFNKKSEDCFEGILQKLKDEKKLTFFLDGHSIGGPVVTTSIMYELEIIGKYCKMNSNDFMIFVDDLRTFDQEPNYPKKIEIINFAEKNELFYTFESDMFIISNKKIKELMFEERRKLF